jgi:hypothetical protein
MSGPHEAAPPADAHPIGSGLSQRVVTSGGVFRSMAGTVCVRHGWSALIMAIAPDWSSLGAN